MLCSMFVDSLDILLNNTYENKLNSIFDHWAKLYLGLNVQPKIQILNGLYSMIRS